MSNDNLLTIAQDILLETKNASIPSSIIGNNDDSAKQVLQALKVSIVELSRSYDWQELQEEKTFASVASTIAYNLPTDFDRFINETFWNSTEFLPVEGPITPTDWRILNNSTISGGAVTEYFRIRGNQVLIYPTPSAIQNYIYEYITNLIVESSIGTGQTGWLADTDLPVIDSYIVRLDATWRLLKNQGRPYSEEQRTANEALAERVQKSGARKTIRHYSPNNTVKIGYPSLIIAP